MTEIDKHIKILLDNKDLENPSSFEELGYIYFGPLIFNYFIWLFEEIKDCDKVLFNSREGYFLKEIYEMFKTKHNLPDSVYFKTSRKISALSAFFTKEDVYRTFELHRYSGKLSNLLKDRFGICKNIIDDFNVDSNIQIPNIDEYIDDILQHSKEVRNEYSKYIFSVIGNSKKMVMIDSGYQGMTQYNIQKAFGIECKGRYFIYKGNPNLKDVKGFYDFEQSDLKKNLIFFEAIFIENIGTYIDIKNGEFINENFNDLFFDKKLEIVKGIKNFINDIIDCNIPLTQPDWKFANDVFNLMCTANYVKNDSLFDIFFHDNYYVRDDIKKIIR